MKIEVTKYKNEMFVDLSVQTDSGVIIIICFGKTRKDILIGDDHSCNSDKVLISLNEIWQ